MLKFNGGRGAVVCDKCRIIFDEDIGPKEYKEIYMNNGREGDLCWRCFEKEKEAAEKNEEPKK